MASLIWLRIVAAASIGLIGWCGELWAMPLSVAVPCLIAIQPTRASAAATSLAYYAAASLPVIAVAKAYWPSSEASGVIMWLAEEWSRKLRDVGSLNLMDAIGIGLSQALAIVPGCSRSGITISAGLFGNLTRESAARFSFLLSTPAIGGAAPGYAAPGSRCR